MDLQSFDISPTRGFLPEPDPARALPDTFASIEAVAADLHKLLAANRLRDLVRQLPTLDVAPLTKPAELRRAMLLYSYLGHGFVWEDWRGTPETSVPSVLAVPWHQLAMRLGRLPVLSYASYALDNWRRIDPAGPIALGNIVLLQNFLAGMDDEWFVLVHVEIEAEAAQALAAIGPAQAAVCAEAPEVLQQHLETIAIAQEAMYQTLLRMRENCDPFIYYNRVRPYIHGFAYHPVVYEGVAAYRNEPQRFFGETGAQSSIVPAFDATLGIQHAEDPLREYLRKMRDYMPPGHRNCIGAIEEGPSIRDYVARCKSDPLRAVYNTCVAHLRDFRTKHIEYAVDYIERQAETSPHNPTQYGTGGTPFIRYLTKHRDETIGL